MIIQITETRKISGKWFIEGYRYSYTGTTKDEEYDCHDCTGNEKLYAYLGNKYYLVGIDGTIYYVPFAICALINQDSPDENKTRYERFCEEMMTDEVATDGDYVKANKEILGIDITSKVDIQYSPILEEIDKEHKQVGI